MPCSVSATASQSGLLSISPPSSPLRSQTSSLQAQQWNPASRNLPAPLLCSSLVHPCTSSVWICITDSRPVACTGQTVWREFVAIMCLVVLRAWARLFLHTVLVVWSMCGWGIRWWEESREESDLALIGSQGSKEEENMFILVTSVEGRIWWVNDLTISSFWFCLMFRFAFLGWSLVSRFFSSLHSALWDQCSASLFFWALAPVFHIPRLCFISGRWLFLYLSVLFSSYSHFRVLT